MKDSKMKENKENEGDVKPAKENPDPPMVGGSIMAVNVEVVATTGYRASKLLGAQIHNQEGQKIGKLDDFIVGSDVEVSVAVVSVGGFLGMGDRKVAVPATLIESDAEGRMVLPGATKDQLKALPEFRYVEQA